jgi:hypothetical protein
MKTTCLLLLSLAATTASHGQLNVTGFDRDGQLAWTNHLRPHSFRRISWAQSGQSPCENSTLKRLRK